MSLEIIKKRSREDDEEWECIEWAKAPAAREDDEEWISVDLKKNKKAKAPAPPAAPTISLAQVQKGKLDLIKLIKQVLKKVPHNRSKKGRSDAVMGTPSREFGLALIEGHGNVESTNKTREKRAFANHESMMAWLSIGSIPCKFDGKVWCMKGSRPSLPQQYCLFETVEVTIKDNEIALKMKTVLDYNPYR